MENQLKLIILMHAGYDISKIRDRKKLDKEAQDLLKAKTTRKGLVFSSWPRDPKGKAIMPENSFPGKMTSNNVQLWGATLYDFYRVQRVPEIKNYLSISTGSKLAAWMKANGELDAAADQIGWAEGEESPREVPPCDMAGIIESIDFKLNMGITGQSIPPPVNVPAKEAMEPGKGKEKEKMLSSFDASSYPAPWPLVPFSYTPPVLQKYIPLHLLPKKLIVHDPWNVLRVSDSDSAPGDDWDWAEKSDMTYTYHLSLSSEGDARLRADADKAAKERAEFQAYLTKTMLVDEKLLVLPGAERGCSDEPFIKVSYPMVPKPEPLEEAHLYLSPAHMAGQGNHSVLYHAEWEVPRSMLMPPSLCSECVEEDVAAIVKEQDRKEESLTDPMGKEKNVVWKCVDIVDEPADYQGSQRTIATRVPWRSADEPYSTLCSHSKRQARSPYPSTTKVRVIAKLSLPNDPHLDAEAINYQTFPLHLFEHWNGFNVVPPLHDPTPVGAVVPQFYGFYKPEKNTEYLSPILLLENCGTPVDPMSLNIDDRNECASLYYRFHDAGWCHGSVAARNILVQPGPLSAWPLIRYGLNAERSFRLIDFGRSQEWDNRMKAAEEETRVVRLFEHMAWA